MAKEGRGGSKKTALQGGYIPCPFGKGKAWEWVKDPPAGEGQVGQKKHLFVNGRTGRIKKARMNLQLTFPKVRNEKARLLEKETSLKAWIQVIFTGLPRIQN